MIKFEDVAKIDMSCFDNIIISNENDTKTEFFGIPGNQHYRLLAYLSTLYQDEMIIDIGTHRGSSALALSYNLSNKIASFDIVDNVTNPLIRNKSNILFRFQNLFTNFDLYKDLLLSAPIILLDIDPHDGNMEYDLYCYLKQNNYQGLLICDDIWHFKNMRNNFWYLVEDPYKFDVTEYGHWSGTGIITFNPEHIENLNQYKNNNDNWTLVTGYFNLTKCPDASAEIKARDQAYYLQHARSTLSLPNNLVIYCDQESYDLIYAIRPSYLRPKTKYVIGEFDDFVINDVNFTEYRKIINQNRIDKPYQFDPRNTASYYLFCMSRYIMLRNQIEENPFDSTHFAWINICIERMGISNVRLLPKALSINRDKFSTCYIDYIPKSLVDNENEYWKWGKCSRCSGWFTGNLKYMDLFCQYLLEKFIYYVGEKRGHADETLYPKVQYEHEEIFENYFGDYQSMISNYVHVYDSPESIINIFIRNAYPHDKKKCLEACEFILKSLKLKTCTLNDHYRNVLGGYYLNCQI